MSTRASAAPVLITDGSVRDLEAMAPEFLVLAGSVMPSHAHVHLVDFGGTVSVRRHDGIAKRRHSRRPPRPR